MNKFDLGLSNSTIIAFFSGVLAILSVGARIMVQGPPFKFYKIMGALAAGVFFAGITSQALMEYKLVSNNFAVWLSALTAIIGDHLVMALWNLGEQAKKDPLNTIQSIFRILSGNSNNDKQNNTNKNNEE